MNASECWEEAYKLHAKGSIREAILLCENEPCSRTWKCQRFLGWQYHMQHNFDKALSWFEKGAAQGDSECVFGMGRVHHFQKNYHDAIKNYETATELGHPNGYIFLGLIYLRGLGVQKDIDKATNYYREAASRGFLIAERALIYMAWQKAGLLLKIRIVGRFIVLSLKALKIFIRNNNDPRLYLLLDQK